MDIIKVKNEGYSRYEELLLRRDGLRKEAYQWGMEYTRVFGDLITSVFEKKIDCIRKKKMISYCQAKLNHGQNIDQNELEKFLDEQMAEYNARLEAMINEKVSAQNGKRITEAQLVEIKKLYHKLAKQLHPDINPMTQEIPELNMLWMRIVISYEANDLVGLQEAEVLTNKLLAELDNGCVEIEIPDIDEKIKEIEAQIKEIIETDPYQYKFLLEDAEAVILKKESLADELKTYTEYEKQLDEILEEMMKSGVTIEWRMN